MSRFHSGKSTDELAAAGQRVGVGIGLIDKVRFVEPALGLGFRRHWFGDVSGNARLITSQNFIAV